MAIIDEVKFEVMSPLDISFWFYIAGEVQGTVTSFEIFLK
jgi:hypothetical protein